MCIYDDAATDLFNTTLLLRGNMYSSLKDVQDEREERLLIKARTWFIYQL